MSRFRLFSKAEKHSPERTIGVEPARHHDEGGTIAAGVPHGKGVSRLVTADRHLVVLHDPESPVAERYRRLRLKLEHIGEENDATVQMVVVTSATPEEGKTTTALNLAFAMAETRDQSVLIVDGDLRRPSVSRYLAPAPGLGLTEVLSGRASLDQSLVSVRDSALTFFPAGTPTSNPLQLLKSPALARVVAELRSRFDHIVVDTPPTVPFTDAAIIQAHADGALLVVRAGQTPRPLIEKARESLSAGVVFGVVLNGLATTPVDRYYYRYDEYRYYESYRKSMTKENES